MDEEINIISSPDYHLYEHHLCEITDLLIIDKRKLLSDMALMILIQLYTWSVETQQRFKEGYSLYLLLVLALSGTSF